MTTFIMLPAPSFPDPDGPPLFADNDTSGFSVPLLVRPTVFFPTSYVTHKLQPSPFALAPGDLNVALPPPGNLLYTGFD